MSVDIYIKDSSFNVSNTNFRWIMGRLGIPIDGYLCGELCPQHLYDKVQAVDAKIFERETMTEGNICYQGVSPEQAILYHSKLIILARNAINSGKIIVHG